MPEPRTPAPPPDTSDAIRLAYEDHYRVLEYIAAQKFHVPDEDIRPLVHDVFLAYIRNRSRVRNARAWLVGATFNSCRLYWRERGREDDVCGYGKPLDAAAAAEDLTARVDAGTVLRRLPRQCREVLHLRFYEEYSSEELARHFATTVGYARKMVHRCVRNARALLTRIVGARQ
ncbi:MAG TPA: sigma-70 family RNA polymerase sigma factor [Thermoanaerobaculia bacterium]|jgi:RNA polymerase sigma factor (sigma-70 family)